MQHLATEIALELDPMGPHIERIAMDWSDGVDHDAACAMKLVVLKQRCTESAKRVVDLALTMRGGTSMYRLSELKRLYREVRCGGFHPANPLLAAIGGSNPPVASPSSSTISDAVRVARQRPSP
jgi:alkylation response protein AidB-like acyl-CoA dehydrogenase